ncbi:endo-1,4-beta-xylanase [Luedemannella helvata]|uniref:Beta-xylanase n=2 Tax=Luedemannella helvata TaxID=349315 RepID=A0ABP4X5X4_9ACTN
MDVRRRRMGMVAVAAVALGTVVTVAVPAAAATTLGAAAAERGRYFGAAVQAAKLTDAAYVGILDREFTVLTPENELKWDATEPARGTFSFAAADRVVDHARAQGQRVRGYGLVGPDAARLSWMGNVPVAELTAVLRNHVTALVSHYRGSVFSWDVVSEAFADTGGGLRPSVWSRLNNGTGWIEEAFRAARAADPDARLCYNDYRIESLAFDKTQAVLAMVADFTARGVPIDCVGLQSHFGSSIPLPADYQATIERFAALGVDVEITQLDIEGSGATQAALYDRAVRACLAVTRCTGITVWGVRDSDSWRSNSTPLLFTAAGEPKAAYTAVLNALNDPGTPTSTAPTSATPTSAAPTSAAPTSSVPTSTAPTSASVPTCRASATISSWGGGFAASVRVTAGPVATNRWAVTIALPPGTAVTSVWGAVPSGRTGTVRLSDAGYNGRIPANGSVTFGLVGTGRAAGVAILACTAG